MFVAGIVAASVGIVLFDIALGKTLRANATARIPFGRNPREVPPGSIKMRALGAGLIVLGAALVGPSGWHWTVMIVLVGPVTALLVLTLHNRRISRSEASRSE